MVNYGGFLGGDGWQLDAGDTRGDTDNRSTTGGGFGGFVVNEGGAISVPGLIGIAAIVLGGLYIINR